MRVASPIHVLCTVAALTLLAACSNSSMTAPKPANPDRHGTLHQSDFPGMDPVAVLKTNPNVGRHITAFYTCPTTGPLTYISDFINSRIYVYAGTFANQAACGVFVSGLQNPEGLFVQNTNHELYVANTFGHNILVFKRGGTSPIRTFVDPTATGQEPLDVAVSSTGIVIASNRVADNGGAGSISTWKPNGTFVNNYPMSNDIQGGWVTVQASAAVNIYFNDIAIGPPIQTVLWTGSCPGGVCGAFTLKSPPATTTGYPAGLRSRAADSTLIEFDPTGGIGGARLDYSLPLFPAPTSCNISGGEPIGFDMNSTTNTIFYADAVANVAREITFGTCALIGIVPNPSGPGIPVGAAHDPPAPL
jgi:hypothetical protein